MGLLRLLVGPAVLVGLHTTNAFPTTTRTGNQTTFDYIVVGSGPGGSVVASRLSEDPNVQVAIVEAGTWAWLGTGNQSEVPEYDFHYNSKSINDTNPNADWGFVTTPQAGINGARSHYARGKSLGGSSNLNYMGYTQTSEGALQRWSDIVDDQSFAYNVSSQYYHRSMNFQMPDTSLRFANATTTQHTENTVTGGPLDVGYADYAQPWSSWLRLGLDEAGIHPSSAFIDGRLNGSAWLTSTVNNTDGHRASAATAFLQNQSAARENLHVIDLTMAKRILFNSERVATGLEVESLTSNTTYSLTATREIIVSAGVFQTPQLLQVSGVGPADLLDQFDIPIVADRPGVGQNMTDHVFFGIAHRVNVDTNSILLYGDNLEQAIDQFNANGTGLLCSPGGDYAAYEKIPQDLRSTLSQPVLDELATYPEDWPELQYFSLPSFVGDFTSQVSTPLDGFQYATMLATLIVPSSRGTVTISSTDTRVQPLINPNWLTTERDREVVVAGFKRMRQILGTPVMSNVTVGDEFYPGSGVSSDDDDAILAQIQTSFNTMYHAATSCRMGPPSDPFAVVDTHARVYGVGGLRIVDASAFPILPPGLPQAQVYWFAEKIADDIKNGN